MTDKLSKNLKDKILDYFGERFKKSIEKKGRLPTVFLFITGGSIFIASFLLCTLFLPTYLIWLRIFIPVISAYTYVGIANGVSKKIVKINNNNNIDDYDLENTAIIEQNNENNLLTTNDNSKDKKKMKEKKVTIASLLSTLQANDEVIIRSIDGDQSIILLTSINKTNIVITPLFIVKVQSMPNGAWNFLPSETLKEIHSKYKFSVIDTLDFEILIFRQDEIKVKLRKANEKILSIINDDFVHLQEIIYRIARENQVEFTPLTDNQLDDIFATYSQIIRINSVSATVELPGISEKKSELMRNLPENEKDAGHYPLNKDKENNEYTHNAKPLTFSLSPIQQQMVAEKKELLLNELNYSFDNYLRAVKRYYRVNIEKLLNHEYPVSDTEFLKVIQLFYEKEGRKLIYPSFYKLEQYERFKSIEVPSADDIENFTTQVILECVTTTVLPEKDRNAIIQFLNEKLRRLVSERKETINGKKVDLHAIPRPSARQIKEAVIEEGN